MATYIIPKITIIEPKKRKHFGYYIEPEKGNIHILKIKAKSHSGRSRGIVGRILKDGTIQTTDLRMMNFITGEIRKKIKLTVDLIYSSSSNSLNDKGLVSINLKAL